jgi:hypothetical protein
MIDWRSEKIFEYIASQEISIAAIELPPFARKSEVQSVSPVDRSYSEKDGFIHINGPDFSAFWPADRFCDDRLSRFSGLETVI